MKKMLSEHFSEEEFRCKHCGEIKVDPLLIAKLECVRAALGHIPIYINSGYRCEEHNKRVGGAMNSYHVKGQAADIRINGDIRELAKICDNVFKYGGMGIYKNFVHVDTGKQRRFLG